MPDASTIVALSSGALPSGVAVIRISGPQTHNLLKDHGIEDLKARRAELVRINDSSTGEVLDRGICLWFPGPESFTGEDCAELQVHGGPAVVDAILGSLTANENTRLSEPGEFSRRAFENGKFDLTEIEGLSDLISAQTEAQRRQALNQGEGSLRRMCEDWRTRLVRIQALIAADIDFVDEDDVPEDVSNAGLDKINVLRSDIRSVLSDDRIGEIIRDGFRVVILGPPNAGKSSLLNTLAKRDVAIVTKEAGTTRDVLDVHLDLNGYEVIFSDTAGIRETDNVVEREGIRRARERGKSADYAIWLQDVDGLETVDAELPDKDVIFLKSKDDKGRLPEGHSISCHTGHGVNWLIRELEKVLITRVSNRELGVVTRLRHRQLLNSCLESLDEAVGVSTEHLDLKSELIRTAGDSLSRLTGRIDVENLLDVIFSEFCVGK